jgi:GAF domain-containing protein
VTDPAFAPPSVGDASEVGALLGQMGAVLLSAETIDTTVELVTALAAETIPGTAGAGVTVMDGRGVRSVAASNPLVEQADTLQYRFEAGPCITAASERITVRVDDVATDDRWPDWCTAVAPLGVRSVLSVPLAAGGSSIGAIKVYSDRPGEFDERAEQVLELFARQAAVLLANTLTLAGVDRTNNQLTEALQNRDLIGQAKGILLARGAADDTEATAMLITAASHSKTKLHDVARRLVASTTDRTTPDLE